MRSSVLKPFLTVTALLFSFGASAFSIKVIDQHGQPVRDAFVAIPEGSVSEVSKEPAVMDQVDVKFVPHVLAVEEGREVIFPNSDNIRHHVYSFSKPKRFEIKLYKGVPKQPIRFEQPGLIALGCNIHDSMLGYIYVSPWPEFKVTDETGIAMLSRKVNKIAVWHPWIKDLKEPLMVELGSEDTSMFQVTLNLTPQKPVKRYKKYKKRYD